MSANGQVVDASPGDRLRERLEDPQVAAALNSLLDHADLLAILVTGLDGFVRRGDEITASLSSTVEELRGAGSPLPGLDGVQAELRTVDVQALAAGLSSLAGAVADAAPALNRLLRSQMLSPQVVDLLADAGEALVEGKAAAAADPDGPKGLYGLWRLSRDRDVTRGLGFVAQVARAFGRRLPHR